MKLNIQGYREILRAIWYWKYHIHVMYRQVEFKFKNTGAGNNGAAKLTIYGITPSLGSASATGSLDSNNPTAIAVQGRDGMNVYVPSIEHVIYTELRGINLERWNVTVPWILDYVGWNCIQGIAGVPDVLALYPGLGYGTDRDAVGIRDALIFREVYNYHDEYGLEFKTRINGDIITAPIQTSKLLSSHVQSAYKNNNELPMIILYTANQGANDSNRKFYNVLPLGVRAYKVKLELANGESIFRLFNIDWQPINSLQDVMSDLTAAAQVQAGQGKG